MNLGIMPLTLAPKSDPDFRRECALTHSIAFGKNAQPAPERCRSERVWDFPTSILQRKICICAHECTACRNYASFCYEVKCGKYTSLKGAQQKWFVRFRILDAVYNEYELKVDIVGKAEHHSTRNSRLKSSSLIC